MNNKVGNETTTNKDNLIGSKFPPLKLNILEHVE